MSIFNTVPPLAAGRGLTFDGETMSIQVPQGAGAHNAIYRGKALGSAVTDAQWAAIAAGTFDDLYIGDYWTINDVNWRIAAFDYYINTGDTACVKHHAVIVPDKSLYKSQLNSSTDVTNSGYTGTSLYSSGLDNAKNTINTIFNGHVLSHRKLLCNAATEGYPTGLSWYDSTVELMTEINVVGSHRTGHLLVAGRDPAMESNDNFQFPLFSVLPFTAFDRTPFWLRDVSTTFSFAVADGTGAINRDGGTDTLGVRPAFSIC